MDLDHRRQAQQRADRIAAFRAELAELEQEQALRLTPEQRGRLETHLQGLLAALTRRQGADVGDAAKRISWAMRLSSLLGGLALFAALILFLHRIWGALSLGVQAGLLTLLPLLLLGASAWVARRQVAAYYTGLWGVATGAAFVLGLSAQGVIFNALPSAQALLVWGAFGLLLAYGLTQTLLLSASLLLLCAYVAALLTTVGGGYWTGFFERAECLLPPAAALYALPEWLGRRQPREFNFAFRFCGAGLGLLALLVLSKTGDLDCQPTAAQSLEMLYQLAGVLLGAGTVVHGTRLGSRGLVNLGAAAFSVFLLVRLHAWCWDWMPKYLFFLLISLTAAGLLLAFRQLRRRAVAGGVR